MGEAKQRRLAREAGQPWECDIPKPPAPYRYLGDDGEWHEHDERRGRRPPTATMRAVLLAMAAMGGGR